MVGPYYMKFRVAGEKKTVAPTRPDNSTCRKNAPITNHRPPVGLRPVFAVLNQPRSTGGMWPNLLRDVFGWSFGPRYCCLLYRIKILLVERVVPGFVRTVFHTEHYQMTPLSMRFVWYEL